MADIVGLLLPFFGLILIGAVAARITKQPAEALGWLNTFIVYAALPALFFKLVSQTPIEQLTRLGFIGTDLAATYSIFVLLLLVGRFVRRNSLPESTMQAFAGAYGNIGYMGPALALLALGEKAAVPVALIVCLENALHFIVAPALMAIDGNDKRTKSRLAFDVARKVLFHPSSCPRRWDLSPPQPLWISHWRSAGSSTISRRLQRLAPCLRWVSPLRCGHCDVFRQRSATSCQPSSFFTRLSSTWHWRPSAA